MNNSLKVFILDDNLPKLPAFIEQGIYQEAIDKDRLEILTKEGDWTGEHNLKHLVLDLLNHEYVKTTGEIEVSGYLHPEICLSDVRRDHKPNVVIYDWEYGAHTFKESADWLRDILKMTDAFIFVYSNIRNAIPPMLNRNEFDEFAERFQLFAKGNADNSVFTSEDFLYQYILSRVSKSNIIKIQGTDVRFEENGYLRSPRDILHLESIFGRTSLLEALKNNKNEISQGSIEKMVESLNGHMLLSRERSVLVTADFPLLANKARPNEEISYLDALREFGLVKLKEVIETGFAKI